MGVDHRVQVEHHTPDQNQPYPPPLRAVKQQGHQARYGDMFNPSAQMRVRAGSSSSTYTPMAQ